MNYIKEVCHREAASEVSRILTPHPSTPAERWTINRQARIGRGASDQAAPPSGASANVQTGRGRRELLVGLPSGIAPFRDPHTVEPSRNLPVRVRQPESRSTAGLPSLRLGMETEFLLAARHPDRHREDIRDFVRDLAVRYNRELRFPQPRMLQEIKLPADPVDYKTWSFVYEVSNATTREPCMPPSLIHSNVSSNDPQLT